MQLTPDEIEDFTTWLQVHHAFAHGTPEESDQAEFHRAFQTEGWLSTLPLQRLWDADAFDVYDIAPIRRLRKPTEDERFVCQYYRIRDRALWPQPIYRALWQSKHPTADDQAALIRFLELDPMFYRSGYAKTEAIVKLSRMELTGEQKARLVAILRAIILSGWGKQIGGWRRLSRMIPRHEAIEIIREALGGDLPAPKKRAAQMYFALEPAQVIQVPTTFEELKRQGPHWRPAVHFVRRAIAEQTDRSA